jgi:hypothetical protein
MISQKVTPLKAGLLIVALAYLLFNIHSLFNLNWWGEWDRITSNPTFQFYIFIEDIVAAVGMAFRFIAGIIAVAAAAYYFRKQMPSKNKLYNILKVILVCEAIYWFGLISTAGVEVYSFAQSNHASIIGALTSLMVGAIPTVMEAIVLPIVILVLALKLNPNKPDSTPIKWGLITGTICLFVFWLTNTSIWISIVSFGGWGGVTNYPVNTISFILTVFGLLALAIYTAGYTATFSRAKTPALSIKTLGFIITAIGMFFFWEYLSWIFFGGDYLWSNWYAWFLGHNLDLWMLSLPLVGLPLLFYKQPTTNE